MPTPDPTRWSKSLSAVDTPTAGTPVSSPARSKSSPPSGFWFREAAYMWDVMIVQTVFSVVGGILSVFFTSPMAALGFLVLWSLISFAGWAAYNIWCEITYGTTLGKYLLGLRVENNDHTLLDTQQAVVRFVCAGVSWLTLNIGHAMCAWRKDKAALHDLISNTRVVKSNRVSFGDWPPVPEHTSKLLATISWVLQGLLFVIMLIGIVVGVGMVMHAIQSGTLPVDLPMETLPGAYP